MSLNTDRERRRNLEIYKRVDEAFNSVGIKTQTARAEVCDVDQPTISKWKKGKHHPSFRNLIDISRRTGYHLTWLTLGTGRKYIEPPDAASDKINRLLQNADAETRARFAQILEVLANEKTPDPKP